MQRKLVTAAVLDVWRDARRPKVQALTLLRVSFIYSGQAKYKRQLAATRLTQKPKLKAPTKSLELET